ncbi:COG3014 family protein [Marinomonas aquimarina]|nr:hypothetical protein [Marinomonas aquimarina]
MKKPLLLLATTVTLTGCAGIMPTKSDQQFSSAVHSGDYTTAAQFALEESGYDPETQTVSDILWAIEAGAILNYAGDYELSNQVFDASEKSMKEVDQESTVSNLLQTGLSMVGNDAFLDYEQTLYDGVMTNTYKAWNFMHAGDYNNARVEWNRAEERQRRAAEFFAEQIKQQEEALEGEQGDNKFDPAEFVAKTLDSAETRKMLEAQGVTFDQWKPYEGYVNPYTTYSYGLNLLLNGKSASDYNKAADAFKRVYGLTNSKQVKADLDLAKSLAKGRSSTDNMVWVIFENGESMVKEEFRLDLPLFLFTEDVAYTGIALPRLKAREQAFPSIQVEGVKTEVIADMDKIIGAEFEKNYNSILTREITRTLLKTVAQKQINDSNPLAGFATGMLQSAVTSADTRTFTSLPKQYQTAHVKRKGDTVKVKAGNFEIPVALDTSATSHIIHVKAVSPTTEPLVRVINL